MSDSRNHVTIDPDQEIRALVDAALIEALSQGRHDAGGAGADLTDEIERAVLAGGKRLRPLFCVWGWRAGGGEQPARPSDPIVRAAAALELLHTFAILHDDVMDRSPLRRGRPASHVALAPLGGARDPERFGASAAILAGDLAMAFADALFHACGFPPDRLGAGAAVYRAMRAEVIGGQFLDLRAAAVGTATPAEARRIGALKSGGYSVEKPLLIGAALAGAPEPVVRALSAYGAPLGEAFQIRDDVLGAFGDPDVTGKDADGDFLEGKRTLLVALAAQRAAPPDSAFLSERLGAPDLSPSEVERVRSILRDTGALAEALRTGDDLLARARSAIAAAPIPAEVAKALDALAEQAVGRDR